MKRFIYTLMISLFVILNNHALGQSRISGYVADQQENPVPFTNIILLAKSDSALVTGTSATADGFFHFTTNQGDYLLKVSMIGYTSLWRDISVIAGLDTDLGTLIIEEETLLLDDIQVSADKLAVEYLADRLVLNVKDRVLSGGTALDVLEQSPGVIVDQQGNEIRLMGKTGVTIMINGKESKIPSGVLAQTLKGMSIESIEKIELITNPPAGADAEGIGGIINIVLSEKKDLGTNGAYSFTGGYGYGEKFGLNFDLAHSAKKIDLMINYSLMRDRTHQVIRNAKYIHLPDGLYQSFTASERFPVQFNNCLRAGIDYRLSSKTTVGSVLSAYSNRWEMDALNHSHFYKPGDSSSLTIDNHEINRWDHLMGNFNLIHTLSQDQKVSFDFDYLYYFDKNPTTYLFQFPKNEDTSDTSEKVQSEKLTSIRFYVFKFDYEHKVSDKIRLETGAKGTFSSFKNDVRVKRLEDDTVIVDPQFSQENLLQENIWAGYFSLTTNFSRTLNLNVGLRYEYTESNLKGENDETLINRYYGQLFPSLLLTQKWNELTKVHFSYSHRIARPTFNDMAPFVIFLGPKTLFSGNAALFPALSDAIKVEAHYKDLLVSLQFTDEDNPIARFQIKIIPGTTKQLIAAKNLLDRKATTLFVSHPVTVNAWWQMQNSFLLSREQIKEDSDGILNEANQWYCQLSTTQMINLPRNFKFELNGYYHSKSLYGAMNRRRAYNLNFGIGKELANEKGNLKLSVNNLFNINDWDFKTDVKSQQGGYIDQQFVPEPRVVRLTFARKFGTGEAKGLQKRNTGSAEEQKRVGG